MTATIVLCLVLLSGSPECQPAIPTDRQLTRPEMLHALDVAGWSVPYWNQALAVAWCESRWQPAARGDNGAAFGLLQVHQDPWQDWSGISGDMGNPVTGLAVAWQVFSVHENYKWYGQWGCAPEYGDSSLLSVPPE